MRLIRGWERQYAPDTARGLRLSRASLYRAIGEEEGLGDRREGEVRISNEGETRITWKPNEVISARMSREISERDAEGSRRRLQELLAAEYDDPELELETLGVDHWKIRQNTKIEDSELGGPYLFCLACEPSTKAAWERLRAALPGRYDTWTVTDELDALNFEIECGIKRWLALNQITRHRIERFRGWVQYSYDSAPPGIQLDQLGSSDLISRWFRKRRKYEDQQEYRFAWNLMSPELEDMPEIIDVELTRTGLGLFKPWSPPK